MKIKNIISGIALATIGGVMAIVIYTQFLKPEQEVVTIKETQKARYIDYPYSDNSSSGIIDLTVAAERSIDAVVHVKSTSTSQGYSSGNPLFDYFFGDQYNSRPRQQVGFGSGVIISEDGYIVTNNHVVANSDELEVILNDRESFTAELIGYDENTDLALLKIDEKGLPYIPYGNSDDIKIGEWVLAVGNPFNLTSTVTAGIVSAKARNIGIIQEQMALESFIQTDAAVNPGNSGGALVNAKGELVGINTAIASRTGSYTGYSFAIPVGIVKKVVADLIEYGEVQRALLGVTIQNITSELAEENKLDNTEGVFVSGVSSNGGAKEAGIKEGDVILEVNGKKTNTISELTEQVGKYRPSDKVNVLVKRDNKKKQFEVVLRNMRGTTQLYKADDYIFGARLEKIDSELKSELGVKYGVQVLELNSGYFRSAGVRESFVITQINNKPIYEVSDVVKILDGYSGGVYIQGIYPNGKEAYYAFGI